MASESNSREVAATTQNLQIYSPSYTGVTPYWKDKYERDAIKYWDVFYKLHQDKFFKNRHYLRKEWGSYFRAEGKKVVLEVGCGAGNTIFPLIDTYPDIFVHACDFSPRAVDLVKAHKEFTEDRVNAFICDLTADDLCEKVLPTSVDIVTMVFVLSAIAPEKMPFVLQNVRKILKPNGYVLIRDYGIGDLAQERLICKDQQISENFYVRGDGTRAYYFSIDFLTSLFKRNGFDVEEVGMCCKQVENRARKLVMNRRWIQAVFRFTDAQNSSIENSRNEVDLCSQKFDDIKLGNCATLREPGNESEIDMSESIASEMFGMKQSNDEVIEIKLRECTFRIKGLPREFQHTCKSTGLMLWESGRVMSTILSENPFIVAGRRVLELGCGSAGICSMVAVRNADLVVASDGDTKALDLLSDNVASNLEPALLNKLAIRRLEWGNKDHVKTVRDLCPEGFEVILGTDVTYIPEAVSPLFETARALISNGEYGDLKPALILCHVVRRVDEPSILSAALRFGFRLVDRWVAGEAINSASGSTDEQTNNGIISSWFSSDLERSIFKQNPAVNIMYFHV
ncbi:hypothetical protein MRB53_020336 [Persea americana]|uniref:Uncharacterized protein n=1 Tax=Persea americana TaxID=3435 RepID=A0ACC2L1W3_PERAE|nr:hypothetical protein MRB53_020336 [Persea americana]